MTKLSRKFWVNLGKFNALWLVFCTGWILYHLILIKRYGKVLIYESNPAILGLEITLIALTVILAVMQIVWLSKGGRME